MDDRTRNLNRSVGLLDMRAQATAVALVQLCRELRGTGALDDRALERIKDVIAAELAERAPRSAMKSEFLTGARERLDRVFAGEEPVGDVSQSLASSLDDDSG